MSFCGKYALITGANGGIGRCVVEEFAKHNCNIIAHMRSEKKEFLSFAEEIAAKYDIDIKCIYFDLSNSENIKKGMQQFAKLKLPIDILINNAGLAHGGLLQMTSIEDIKKVFDINYFAVAQMMQIVSRYMLRRGGGSIVNVASISGLELAAGNCAYGTSKAAVIALTKTVAKEFASMNIRVNSVAPGLTDTNMASLMDKKARRDMVRNTAFGRLATPKEISDVIIYLSSDKASFITGQVLRVDGGM